MIRHHAINPTQDLRVRKCIKQLQEIHIQPFFLHKKNTYTKHTINPRGIDFSIFSLNLSNVILSPECTLSLFFVVGAL